MKVTFLLNLDLEHKAGLYNAIHNRMRIQQKQFDSVFYNIITIDSKPLMLLKKIFKKKNIHNNIEPNETIIDGITYINIYYKNSISGKIFDYLRIDYFKYRKIINTIKDSIKDSDMIIAHFGYPHGRIAYYIDRIFNINYIVYYHGSDIHTFTTKNEKNRIIMFETMNKAKANIFVSNSLMKQVINMGYSKENLYSSCNGIDTNIFNMIDIRNKSSTRTVGFIGNLETIKRAEFLPEIFKNIKDKFDDVQFVVIGDGSLRKQMELKCSEYKLSVNFTGRLSQDKIVQLLNLMDILVLPSRKEAWGCVILEANACGVYCIGTDTGGIGESVGQYGILVENNDNIIVNDISKYAIEIMEKSIDRYKLSNRAKQFSWLNICEKEYELINNL
ncbi:glycosyltransferase [Clostridium saccharobutylicum]|uniref:Putative teichuronic acid biosynthesis glycosyltransferase TuaC n=1 Tax=Clostridium saccharobutylicum TaxID=169679 RepID=A0A1S8NJA3_CLOSA|nr:glycosyltransferase [Clostridium saccharobutylicum]OOM16546.1 putative teichuronic acid biosynthesis glycosyltransferase TuaC [Clostridium saccharobutylicum]